MAGRASGIFVGPRCLESNSQPAIENKHAQIHFLFEAVAQKFDATTCYPLLACDCLSWK
jgi:hypothetical protein